MNPDDIELRQLPTGELIAFDTKRNKQIASGFDNEDDFEEWLNAKKASNRPRR